MDVFFSVRLSLVVTLLNSGGHQGMRCKLGSERQAVSALLYDHTHRYMKALGKEMGLTGVVGKHGVRG